MPRAGAVTLCDLPADARVVVRCAPCNRVGIYTAASLRQLHDFSTAMPDLLNALTASCPKHQTLGIERCKAVYDPPPADLVS
jgi:hypothetical protein